MQERDEDGYPVIEWVTMWCRYGCPCTHDHGGRPVSETETLFATQRCRVPGCESCLALVERRLIRADSVGPILVRDGLPVGASDDELRERGWIVGEVDDLPRTGVRSLIITREVAA